MVGPRPVPDQYYPGGIITQGIDWNEAQHEDIAVRGGATTGATGPVGPQGYQGVDGQQGPPGDVGPTGMQGPPGTQGAQGPAGDFGPPGPVGSIGPTGDVGPPGQQGMALTGPAGSVGPTGLQGPVGPQGSQGNVGVAGPQGSAGATGPQGVQGPIGVQGTQGVIGPTGPLGAWVGATGVGPQGYFQLGNIIQNWGLINANTVGVTGNFTKPYIDGPPAFTVGGSTGPTGGQPYVSAISKTGLVIRTQSGNAAVYWRTIGT